MTTNQAEAVSAQTQRAAYARWALLTWQYYEKGRAYKKDMEEMLEDLGKYLTKTEVEKLKNISWIVRNAERNDFK